MTDKIENIGQLLIHLTKVIAAYRKSYRLCRNVSVAFKIGSGLIGCTAILALVPAIPIVVVVAGAIPAGIQIILSKTQIEERKALLKAQHRNFKQLHSYAQKMAMQKDADEKEIIKSAFSSILEFEKQPNYVEPMERYLKRYKLNGYK